MHPSLRLSWAFSSRVFAGLLFDQSTLGLTRPLGRFSRQRCPISQPSPWLRTQVLSLRGSEFFLFFPCSIRTPAPFPSPSPPNDTFAFDSLTVPLSCVTKRWKPNPTLNLLTFLPPWPFARFFFLIGGNFSPPSLAWLNFSPPPSPTFVERLGFMLSTQFEFPSLRGFFFLWAETSVYFCPLPPLSPLSFLLKTLTYPPIRRSGGNSPFPWTFFGNRVLFFFLRLNVRFALTLCPCFWEPERPL